MNKYTIKTDKAYFEASERVFDIYSEASKYALSVFIDKAYFEASE